MFKLGGKGMPDPRRRGLGDLLVQVVIEVPKKLSKEEQTLLRELAELEHKHVAPERKSFFEKLKEYFTADEEEAQDWPTRRRGGIDMPTNKDQRTDATTSRSERDDQSMKLADDDRMADARRRRSDADAADELAARERSPAAAAGRDAEPAQSHVARDRRRATYAALPVLRDLLPVVDNIDRAIEAAEKAGEAENCWPASGSCSSNLHTLLKQQRVRADRGRRRSRSTRISTRRSCSSHRPTCRPAT